MSTSSKLETPPTPTTFGVPFYYGWVNVVMAALAMTATLPGRTFGLGLIAASLSADFAISELTFADYNFWAVILGAALASPIGRAIDRFGTRLTGTFVLLGLAAAVCAMTMVQTTTWLFTTLVFVRGLGQGALSAISLAMVGKWFTRRVGPAMGLYSVLMAIGFTIGLLLLGSAVEDKTIGWRPGWWNLGLSLAGLAALCAVFTRSTPESCGLTNADDAIIAGPSWATGSALDATLGRALRTPAFWVFTLSACAYNLVISAIMLSSENLLKAKGLDPELTKMVQASMAGPGLIANLLGGWLATRWPMGRILFLSMLALAGALAAYPLLESRGQVLAYAIALGVSGGFITVVFFAFYAKAYGRTHLGRIQTSAHILSTFASALGPVLLAWCNEETASYDGFFYAAVPVVIVLGVAGWLAPWPKFGRNYEPEALATGDRN